LRSSELPDGTWPIDDDLFDSLAGLLDDEIDTTGQDSNDYISDLESCGHSQGTKDVRVKLERGSKGAKKRKFNPDSDVIAAATDETLKQLDIDPNSKEGKAKRRQIRNRLSAQFHRDRKNAHLNTMEQQLANKDMEIASLKEQVTMLLAENEYLRKLHPGFVSARPHAGSVSSYPSSVASQHHTDSEDTQNTAHFLHHPYAPPAASSASSLTVSPHESPQHVVLEGLLPCVGHINVPMSLPPMANKRAGAAPAAAMVSQGRPQGAGPGMLQVPSGFARPLSIITMVCMVSIMLLSGTQSPSLNGVTMQYSPYQQQQEAQRAQYVQFIAGGTPQTDLTVGSEVLTLMQSGAGGHNVETKHSVTVDLPDAPARASDADASQGRRLSSMEDESSDEDSQSNKRQRGSADSARSRSRSNSLYDPSLMTTDEEGAATKAISTLKLVEDTAMIRAGQRLQSHQNATPPVHQHLRRSQAASAVHPAARTAAVRNVSRQVIYSAGVVSRGLVDDAARYGTARREGRVFTHSTAGGENATSEANMGEEHSGFQDEGMFESSEYHWPASQAFDYAVQSYSKVVLTEGQALLDPSLALHKNPFAWTRAMFRNDANRRVFTNEAEQEAADREPVIVDRDIEGYEDDAEMKDAPAETRVGANTQLSTVRVPPVRALSGPVGPADEAALSNAVVPVTTVKQEPTHAHLPAVLHHADAYDPGYDQDPSHERTVLNKLLGESNFLTLKLPASSIRVGKNWSDSKSGTVESIMEVFNISAPGMAQAGPGGDKASFGGPEASVEINCIILGAKLVLSEHNSA
jgi:hypothetical protein